MGLFSKKSAPVVHAAVKRVVYVPATEVAANAHLDGYSSLFSPKRADPHQLHVATSGGWTAIRLPDAVHPWQLHNLAYWMLDCPGVDGDVIAASSAATNHPGYRLVRDPEVSDALCGWDGDGNGWTVQVPSNDIVRPEDVPVSKAIIYPSGFFDWTEVTLRLEDPGNDMNPRNEPTFGSRQRLHDRTHDIVF